MAGLLKADSSRDNVVVSINARSTNLGDVQKSGPLLEVLTLENANYSALKPNTLNVWWLPYSGCSVPAQP